MSVPREMTGLIRLFDFRSPRGILDPYGQVT